MTVTEPGQKGPPIERKIMNIASLLTPKSEVEYVFDDFSVRQCIEKMTFHSYNAIPVLKRDGSYVTTLSQADLLTFLYKRAQNSGDQSINLHAIEDVPLQKWAVL